MHKILDDKKTMFDLFKKTLYIAFAISFFFYTAFKVSLWNNELIIYYLDKIFTLLFILKSKVLMPLLFLTELITLFYKVKNKDNYKRDVASFAIFLLLYLLMKRYAYYSRFEELIVFIYFAKYLNFNQIIKLYTIVALGSALFNIWGCLVGYLPIDGPGKGYTWGFSHSNGAALFYTMLFFAIAYCLRKNKALITLSAIPFLYLNISVFRSRTPSLILLVFIVLLYLEDLYKKIKTVKSLGKTVDIMCIIFPVLMILLSICIGVLIVNNKLYIDYYGNTRFEEIVWIYREKGLSLHFRDLLDTKRYYYFDNGYAQLLFKHGVIPFVIIYYLWISSEYKMVKNADYMAIIISISLFVYMLMEFVLLNDLILVMIAYFTSQKEENDI